MVRVLLLSVVVVAVLSACSTPGESPGPDLGILDSQVSDGYAELGPDLALDLMADQGLPDGIQTDGTENPDGDNKEAYEIQPDNQEDLPEPLLEVTFLAPESDSIINLGKLVTFAGQVDFSGLAQDDLLVTFESDVDDVIGEADMDDNGGCDLAVDDLSTGPHTITLRAAAGDTLSATDSILLYVNSPPTTPTVTISPSEPSGSDDLTATLEGEPLDPDGDEVTVSIEWFKNGNPMAVFDGLLVVPHNETTLSDSWSVVVKSYDGLMYGPVNQDKVTILNGPPSVATVTLGPEPAFTTTVLTCLGEGWFDPEDSPPLYQVEWQINGQPIPGQNAGLLESANFVKADEVQCLLTPDDGFLTGPQTGSNIVIIANTPPGAGTAKISPPGGMTTTEFTCVSDGAVDLDNDTLEYQVKWLVGGNILPDANNAILPSGTVFKGELVQCEATPFDGTDYGPPDKTDAILIANTKPVVSGVSIAPADATGASELTCLAAEATDADEDPITLIYQWQINTELVDGEAEATLAAEHISKYDEVICGVTPEDDEQSGPSVWSETLVIANALPTLEGATVVPETGSELELFFCTAQGWSDPDEDLFEVAFQWKVNGEIVPDETAGTLSGFHFDKGDNVVCLAIPKNGDELGALISSPVATVGNSPPYVNSAQIDPPSGGVATVFECTFDGLADPDAVDNPYVTIAWIGNGEVIADEDQTTLSGAIPGKGVQLQCSVTPTDGESTGASVLSNAVPVVNTAPILLAVNVEPTDPPLSTDTFTCAPFGWIDPDGDLPDFTFRWFVNGVEVEGETTPTLTGVSLVPDMTIACEATPVDNEGSGQAAMSAPVAIINHPPTLDSVALSPAEPDTLAELTCSPTGFVDPDGEPEGYLYSWLVNDQTLDAEDSATLGGESFVADDLVICRVTPFDGFAQGDPVDSNAVTIKNTAPAIASVNVIPDNGTVETVYSCEPEGWSDPDDDPEDYLFVWWINNEKQDELNEAQLAAPAIWKNDILACQATPTDGKSTGLVVFSNPTTVNNSPPTIDSVSVTPEKPATATMLTCTAIGWTDADGDEEGLLYGWKIDDVPVPLADQSTLSADTFSKQQKVVCVVTPTDGTDPGTPVSSIPATILNTLPLLSEVTISPAEAGRQEQFTCTPGEGFDEDGDEVTYAIKWYVNDQDTGQDGSTFEPTQTQPDDAVFCRMSPCDDEGCGNPIDSADSVIINYPPTLTGAGLTPEDAYVTTTLTCAAQGWVDADNDAEDLLYAWTVEGGLVEGADGPTLQAPLFKKHDSVSCTVTPFDGYNNGQEVESNSVTLLNTLPTIAAVAIDPPAGTRVTTFGCPAPDVTDADDDDVTLTTEWLVNENVVATSESFQAVAYQAGDTLQCRVTPHDGEVFGLPIASEPILIGNTAPVVETVTLGPDEAYTNTILQCTALNVSDNEDDPVGLAYVWTVDGEVLPDATMATLTGGQFGKGNLVTCKIIPNDGIDNGETVESAAVTILNTAPESPEVSVTPLEPTRFDELLCQVDVVSDDLDGDEVTYTYVWFKDDVEQEGLTDATIPPAETMECEIWRCIATAHDDETSGGTAEAQETIAKGVELCDNHDNDCDDEIDEDFDVLVLPCDGLTAVTYRQPVTVGGPAGWLVTDFQVRVQVAYQNGMQPDFADIRFTAADGTTLLSHWLESHISATYGVFWVKIPSIPASPGTTTIYVYYGNPQASSRSDIHSVFLFGDDFSDADWTTENWSNAGGTWTVSSGMLLGNGNSATYRSAEAIPEESRVMEGRMSTTVGGQNPWDMGWLFVKYKDTLNDVYALIYHHGGIYSGGDVGITVEYQGGSTVYDTSAGATPAINPASWNNFKVQVNGVNAKLWVNGQLHIEAENGTIANLVNSSIAVGTSAANAKFDDIRVRKYAPSDPSVTAGSIQPICVPLCSK
jgi:hypothetical protein